MKIDREALAAGEIRGQKIDRRVQYFLGLGDLEAGETFKITHNYGVPWPGPKFWCPDIEQNYDSNNYRIFRYADAILMMAECYCNLENAEETMRYLNMGPASVRASIPSPTSRASRTSRWLSAASAPGSWAASSSASSTSCAGASGTTRPTPIPTTRRSRARCAPATATIPFPTRSAPLSGYVLTNDEYLADGL